jgi:electron transfer flavoprotein alpha subunit
MFRTNLRTFWKISHRNASTLVVAEHDGKAVTQGTLACITAAKKIGGEMTLFITGSQIEEVINSAKLIQGPNKILSLTTAVGLSSLSLSLSAIAHSLCRQLIMAMVRISQRQ